MLKPKSSQLHNFFISLSECESRPIKVRIWRKKQKDEFIGLTVNENNSINIESVAKSLEPHNSVSEELAVVKLGVVLDVLSGGKHGV